MAKNKKNNTMKSAVEDKVKNKYLDMFEEYLGTVDDKIAEHAKIIQSNEAVLALCQNSAEVDKPIIKEAIESFEMVIEMNKSNKATAELKREAVLKVQKMLKSGNIIRPIDFLVEFDKFLGI